MLRSILLFVAMALTAVALNATDFVLKKLTVREESPGAYRIEALVRNDNILADGFRLNFAIYEGQNASGELIKSEDLEQPTLEPFTERTVAMSTLFRPSGVRQFFHVAATIFYEFDINVSNNSADTTFEYLPAAADCQTTVSWHPGTPMRVVRNLRVWPTPDTLFNVLRPGDVVAISALVEDDDYHVQNCGCEGQDSSAMYGPFPDEVEYHWSLQGPGSLILPTIAGAEDRGPVFRSTVLYKVPTCDTSISIDPVIRLVVRNVNSKAIDDTLVGSVSLKIFRGFDFRPIPTGGSYTRPTHYTCRVFVDSLRPSEGSIPELASGGLCTPISPAWTSISPIERANEGITFSSADNVCPEYATLASIRFSDLDAASLTCNGGDGSCPSNEGTILNATDRVSITWSIIGGNGGLPLGNVGPSVVVRRSASQPTIIQCVVSNLGSSMFDDESVTYVDTLPPVGKERALVALGDDEGTGFSKWAHGVFSALSEVRGKSKEKPGEWPYQGKSYFIPRIHATMRSRLEAAGYEVIAIDSTRTQIVLDQLSSPCLKYFAFTGHGSGGKLYMTRFFNERTGAFDVTDKLLRNQILSSSQSVHGCRYQPYVRNMALMACESLKHNWESTMLYGRATGWYKETNIVKVLSWVELFFRPSSPPRKALD